MTLWRVEIQFDGTSVVGPTDGSTTVPIGAGRSLIVADNTATYAVRETLTDTVDMSGIFHNHSNADGALFIGFNGVTLEQDPFDDPFAWNIPGGGGPAAGPVTAAGSASFLATGTLAIEKDFPNNILRFISPLGTVTASLAALAAQYPGNITPDDSALAPFGIAHSINPGDPPTAPQSETTLWHNLRVLRNGVSTALFPMTAAAPLVFNPIVGGVFGINTNDIQLATRFQTQNVEPVAAPAGVLATAVFDEIAGGQQPVSGLTLDCCPAWPHRWVICAYCDAAGALYVRRSDDNGHTWAIRFVAMPAQCLSPSIQWLEGLIVILYFDGSQIQKTVSRDGFFTWSAPMPVPITGSNPRLVISPDSTWFYFYWASGSGGSIQVQRSFDQGATLFDASPIVVATSVPQQDFGAVISSDLYLVVAYQGGDSLWHSVKSQDYGISWSNA